MDQNLKVTFGKMEELFPLDFNAFTISNIQCISFGLKDNYNETVGQTQRMPIYLAIGSKFNEILKPSKVVGYEYQLELALNLELKLAQSDQEQPFSEAKFDFVFQFELKQLSNHFKLNNLEHVLGLISLANIAGIAYSTSRGLILNYLERTKFQGYILPLINPVSLV